MNFTEGWKKADVRGGCWPLLAVICYRDREPSAFRYWPPYCVPTYNKRLNVHVY